jgi:Skp family chaperone for outer membrane proteins
MLRLRRAAWILFVGIAVVGLMGSVAWAAPAANEPKIAIVDSQKVYKEAPRIRQYQESLDAFKQLLTGKLDIRSQNWMLDETEIQELIGLKTKDKPTDADNARIKVLTDSERAKDDELKTLQQTTAPTDQQKARLNELTDLQKKSKDTANATAKDYETQYSSKMGELQTKIDAELQAAVVKVAESKGYTLVLDKAVVMLGGTDISDLVIGALDRKAN